MNLLQTLSQFFLPVLGQPTKLLTANRATAKDRRDGVVKMIFSEAVIFQGDRGSEGRQWDAAAHVEHSYLGRGETKSSCFSLIMYVFIVLPCLIFSEKALFIASLKPEMAVGKETGQIGFEETGSGEESIQLLSADCNVNRPFLCCQQPRLVVSVSNGRVFEALKADEHSCGVYKL